MTRKVFLLDHDVTERIKEIPPLIYQAADYGQLAINDINSLIGDNRTGFWDTGNIHSIMYNVPNLKLFKIRILFDDTLVFKGHVQTVTANYHDRTAEIKIVSDLQEALNQHLIYASQIQDTPTNIAREICNLYKIPINTDSFGRSNGLYVTNNVFLSAFWTGDTTIMDSLQAIAEMGVARIYNVDGELHFDAWRVRESPGIYTLTDSQLDPKGVSIFEHPTFEPVEKEIIKGYAITTAAPAGINIATRGLAKDQGKQINGGMDNPLRIMTFAAGVWIGEQWFNYMNRIQTRITLGIPIRLGRNLSINDPVAINYRGRDYLIDITSIDNSSRVKSTIVGLDR